KQRVFQREDEMKNEIDNLRRYKFIFKEKFKSMLNLYLKMLETEEFEEQGDYEFSKKTINDEKIDEVSVEKDVAIEETENE
ncbi:unnamed protein product, partial [marine sediment metagenome]